MNPQQQFWPIADTRFPWLTREQVLRLEQVTSNFDWLQKLQKQQELYQQAIKQIQANKNQEDRVAAENEKYCRSLSKDTKEMTTDQCSVRLEQLADTVKNYYWLNPNVDTNTIVDWLVKLNKQKKVDNELLNKYLDSWDKEYLYQMGFEKRPEEWNNIDYLKIASAIYNPVWTLANEAWKYFGEHPAEITVWAAQSPWKWWYNLIWQWIDRAWKSLAWKLEWTDLANFIKQSAIDLFWEDEVRKYAEQKQQELKNWTAFNGRDATDIRTPLLWDKADSTATQIWETIWDIWTAIALSYPMAAATSSYMWAANATQAARTILLWSTQWAADMAAYELWANNEMASPTEMGVWWLIWAAAPLVVPMFSSISKSVSSKYWEIMNSLRTANKWKLRSELVDLFSRWVKPSSAWVKSTAAQEKIYDDAMDAVETIIWNKNNLRYVTQDWEEIYWKLPTNTREFAQALEQSKRDIYNQYNAITNWAWERIEISTDWLIDELLKLKNDKAAMLWNEWLENAIDSWLNGLKEVKSLTPAQVQRKMQEINKKLEAFYKNPNPNDVSWNSVDALVKNWLSKEMDNAIESALWSSAQYEELKRAYASLKTIEKDVNHRAIVSWRQSPNSLVDSIADISSAENIIDMLTNPTAWLKVLWKQALKKYIKSSNSSDNMVKKLFEKAEKELERSWTLKTRQQILKQQQQEYERWLNQWADKNYLPFIEWADDAWKTVIPWGERIAVTPEWNAVREWQINEINTQKSLENGKNSEYNYNDLNSNQLNNGNNRGNQGWIEWNLMDWWRNWEVVQGSSMTNGWTTQGWAWMGTEPIVVDNWEEMVNISKDLQSKAERWLFMDVHSAEDYSQYKNFSNSNKSAAISVKPDWDIINFVSNEKGAWKQLMFKAIEAGWNKMDNYWVWLTQYYENFWFEPVARVKFNREYAPNWWDFEKWWEPDIYVMKHNWDSLDAVKSKYWTYKHKTQDELRGLPEMDYDGALQYRDNLIELNKRSQKDLKTSEEVLNYAKENQDLIFDLYRAEKWTYVNPDDFRKYINDWWRLAAADTHEWASTLSDTYFKELLDKAGKWSKWVVVAGWPWSWKWYSAKKLWINAKDYELFVDKTKGNKELYKMLDKWMDVDYYVVIPDIDKVIGQITWRAIHEWRTLPINSRWLPTHKEVTKVAQEVLEKSKNWGQFRFHFVTNPWKWAWETEELWIQDWMKLFKEYSNKIDKWTPERVEKEVRNYVDEEWKRPTEKQIKELIASIWWILAIWSMLWYNIWESEA